MKAVLKIIDPEKDLNYDQSFNSPKNIEIYRKLILELKKSLNLSFRPSFSQLTMWLNILHKLYRSQRKLTIIEYKM